MRRRAAAALAAPGAPVHEFCYVTGTLQRLLGEGPAAVADARAGPRAADWFTPAMHLPSAGDAVDATGSLSAADMRGSVPPVKATMQVR